MKIILLGILLIVVGLIFIIMAFTEPTWETGGRIFAGIIGLIFLALPTLFITSSLSQKVKDKKSGVKKPRQSILKSLFAEDIPDAPLTKKDRFIANFRESYSNFFDTVGLEENSAFQYNATQYLWHFLSLWKKRLDKKNIKFIFTSKRKQYSGVDASSEHISFDGKYRINESTETVTVTKKLTRNNSVLFKESSHKLAHYVITGTKTVGDEYIICPNCGSKTTRENLVDGCDYCSTKFTIRDLQNKVSAFRLKDDYEIQYKRYQNARSKFKTQAYWIMFAFFFVIACVIYFVWLFKDMVEYADNSIVLGILFSLLTSGIIAALFAFPGVLLFWSVIFPLIHTKESIRYFSKRRIDRMKKSYALDTKTQSSIRNSDPLFSVSAFYSELINKLACIHFADSKSAAGAFFENGEFDSWEKYRDIVDMDVESIRATNYRIEDGLQLLNVNVTIRNLVDDGRRLKKQKEKISLVLVKSEECKTQAVCEPTVFKCIGCGNSIALEQGGVCAYCGKRIDLKQYDWVIRSYK